MSVPTSALWPGWRLELFYKSQLELRDTVVPMLRKYNVQRVNITNKAKEDELIPAVQLLRSELPSLDVCVHYSLKFNSPAQPRGRSRGSGVPGSSSNSKQGVVAEGPRAALPALLIFCGALSELHGDRAASGMGGAAVAGNELEANGGSASPRADDGSAPEFNGGRCIEGGNPSSPADACQSSDEERRARANQSRMAGRGEGMGAPADSGAGSGRAAASCLLVSGSHRVKSRLDTVQALQLLAGGQQASQAAPLPLPPLYVAFNPYLPDKAALEEERQRLAAKLRGGSDAAHVAGVYLQMGTDLRALEEGLDYLRHLAAQHGRTLPGAFADVSTAGGGDRADIGAAASDQPAGGYGGRERQHRCARPGMEGRDSGMGLSAHPSQGMGETYDSISTANVGGVPSSGGGKTGGFGDDDGACAPLQVYGSVFLPTKRLLAQMRFRPWNGVFLSDRYLSGLDVAYDTTRLLLAVYRARGVIPLVESAVRTDAEAEQLQQLLSQGWANRPGK